MLLEVKRMLWKQKEFSLPIKILCYHMPWMTHAHLIFHIILNYLTNRGSIWTYGDPGTAARHEHAPSPGERGYGRIFVLKMLFSWIVRWITFLPCHNAFYTVSEVSLLGRIQNLYLYAAHGSTKNPPPIVSHLAIFSSDWLFRWQCTLTFWS